MRSIVYPSMANSRASPSSILNPDATTGDVKIRARALDPTNEVSEKSLRRTVSFPKQKARPYMEKALLPFL